MRLSEESFLLFLIRFCRLTLFFFLFVVYLTSKRYSFGLRVYFLHYYRYFFIPCKTSISQGFPFQDKCILWHICEPIYEVRQPIWNRRQFVVILLDWHRILVDPSPSGTVDVSFSSFSSYVYSFISHTWRVIKKENSLAPTYRTRWYEAIVSLDREFLERGSSIVSLSGTKTGISKHRSTDKEKGSDALLVV